MQITIQWQRPIRLTKNRKLLITNDNIPECIEDKPGVYFFSRKFGNVLVPFYIGESKEIRKRLKFHLNSVPIYKVLSGISSDTKIKNGPRYFHYGYLTGNAAEPLARRRRLITQKHMIREAVEDGIPILNNNLVKFKTHTLTFNGTSQARAIFEETATVEAM